MLGIKLNHVSKNGPRGRWVKLVFVIYISYLKSIGNTNTVAPSAHPGKLGHHHYSDIIMSAMASQITSWRLFTQPFIQGAGQTKHQSSASLAFVRGIHRWPANSPHKGPVTRKMFPSDDVIMVGHVCFQVSQAFMTFDFIFDTRWHHSRRPTKPPSVSFVKLLKIIQAKIHIVGLQPKNYA